MAGLIMEDEETRRAYNDLCRHLFIVEIYKRIIADMMVCEIEGWDRLEYIKMIKKAVDFAVKNSKGDDTDES